MVVGRARKTHHFTLRFGFVFVVALTTFVMAGGLSAVLAQSAPVSSDAEPGVEVAEPLVLTPMAFIELALNRDEGSRVAEVTLENARITYERQAAAHAIGGSPHALRTAEINWMLSQRTYHRDIADRIVGFIDQMIGLEQSAMRVQVERLNLDLAELVYKRTQRMFDAKIANVIELTDAQLNLSEATLAYERTLFDATKSRERIEKQLGIGAFEIAPPLEYVPGEFSYDEAWAELVEDNLDIIEADHQLFLAEMELFRMEMEGAAELNLLVAQNELELAQYRRNMLDEQLETMVDNAVLTAVQAMEQYDIALERLEVQRERYARIEQQVEAGFLGREDLLSAEVNLLRTESALLDAFKGYMSAAVAYDQMLGRDVTNNIFFGQKE